MDSYKKLNFISLITKSLFLIPLFNYIYVIMEKIALKISRKINNIWNFTFNNYIFVLISYPPLTILSRY